MNEIKWTVWVRVGSNSSSSASLRSWVWCPWQAAKHFFINKMFQSKSNLCTPLVLPEIRVIYWIITQPFSVWKLRLTISFTWNNNSKRKLKMIRIHQLLFPSHNQSQCVLRINRRGKMKTCSRTKRKVWKMRLSTTEVCLTIDGWGGEGVVSHPLAWCRGWLKGGGM